jgi:Uma2 family endonuclease
MDMRAEVTRKLFTVDEYYRMVKAGILHEKDRVELIEGEIIEMSPIGHRHSACVDRATELFVTAFKGKAIVSVQHPLRLDIYNEPQPDLIVLKRRADFYSTRSKFPDDTLFVVEVSDSSLRYDTKIKLPLYARSGVPELWIENLQQNVLTVCREPTGTNYKSQTSFRPGDSISPLAFPEITFEVKDLLG